MKIISLGGVGGCPLAEALRDLEQLTYPYNWIFATQSFVIRSFNDFNQFFVFDERYVYDTTKLLHPTKKAIILHDFNHFRSEREAVIAKYKRRFERLNECLYGNDDTLLFVRLVDHLKDKLEPYGYYDTIFIREEEDMDKWEHFMKDIQMTYNKKAKLVIITNREDLSTKTYHHLIIHVIKDHRNHKLIGRIIQDTMNSAFEPEKVDS